MIALTLYSTSSANSTLLQLNGSQTVIVLLFWAEMLGRSRANVGAAKEQAEEKHSLIIHDKTADDSVRGFENSEHSKFNSIFVLTPNAIAGTESQFAILS